MKIVLAVFLLAFGEACFGQAFEVSLPSRPPLGVVLDREYSVAKLEASDLSSKADKTSYMFTPTDEQSAALLTLGRDVASRTEEEIAKTHDGAKATRVGGQINGKAVEWLHYANPKHLYCESFIILPDKAGAETRISIWIVANTPERLRALKEGFSRITFQ